MKKNKLVKGSLKRVIAVVSAFMLSCNAEIGAIGNLITSYAQEAAKATESEGDAEPEIPDEDSSSGENKDSEETDESTESGETDESTESGETDGSTDSEESDGSTESGESDESTDSEESDGSTESGETDKSTESGESDESTESGESDESTESGESDESTGSGESDESTESGESDESTESGETDESTESGESDESTGSDESDQTDDTVEPDTPDNEVGVEEVDKPAAEETVLEEASALMRAINEESWFLSIDDLTYEDGFYFMTPEGGSKTKVTKKYIALSDHVIYVGADGKMVTKQWLEEEDGFRYVDSLGEVQIGRTKLAGGFYGTFDNEGLWTAIEYEFFVKTLDNGAEVWLYSAGEGRVWKIQTRYCYFKTDAAGKKYCFLTNNGTDYPTNDAVKSTWIDDLYINEDGVMVADVKNIKIGDKYYDFDKDGHSELANSGSWYLSDLTPEGDGFYYTTSESGSKTKVTEQFIQTGDNIIYVGTDGNKVTRKWLETESGFRYVDDNGYVQISKTKLVGGFYGTFDKYGCWTENEYEFFDKELQDGTKVEMYSGKEGKVWGINKRYGGFLTDDAGKKHCYLTHAELDYLTDELVTNTWIENLYVDDSGALTVNVDSVKIGDIYYSFDQNGHGSAISYPIAYELDGGINSTANPAAYTGMEAKIALSAPARSGYNFDGWYTNSSFTERITELTSKNNDSKVVLYAKWVKKSSGGGGGSSSSSGGGSSNSTNNSASTSTTTNNKPPAVTVTTSDGSSMSSAKEGQSVAISMGQTTVAAAVAQTTAGSINGNMIVSTAVPTVVSIAEGKMAIVATIAVGADGSTRALLAADLEGASITQTTNMVNGIAVIQNIVAYADGTTVLQKSGATEMSGFIASVVADEQAIQSGKALSEVYNGKVDLNLEQYTQVGSAVSYEVVAGVNGAVPQTQMEQTGYAKGQSLVALITDANGNVTASTIVVGDGGIVQYQIPGTNCIVRFLQAV